MAISTYAELKTSIANWLDRSDLTSRIPEFIAFAEANIATDVRVRQMEKRVTASVSTEYFDLPTDYLEMLDIQLNTDPIRRLKYHTTHQMDTFAPSATTGEPTRYTIIGTEVQVKPVPDATYTLEVAYISKFTAFSDDTDTNWLLTNHPQIYLYGALVAAEPFLDNTEKAQIWGALYNSAVENLNNQDKNARHPGPLARRPDVGRE